MNSTEYISSKIDENSLYFMLSSGFIPIQKSSFFILNYLYENYIPDIIYKKNEDDDL